MRTSPLGQGGLLPPCGDGHAASGHRVHIATEKAQWWTMCERVAHTCSEGPVTLPQAMLERGLTISLTNSTIHVLLMQHYDVMVISQGKSLPTVQPYMYDIMWWWDWDTVKRQVNNWLQCSDFITSLRSPPGNRLALIEPPEPQDRAKYSMNFNPCSRIVSL